MRELAHGLVAVATTVALVAATCVPAFALDGGAGTAAVGEVFSTDGLTYKVTAAGEVSLGDGSTTGAADLSTTGTSIVIPESVEHAGVSYAVTSIAPYALWNKPQLEAVTIPGSVKTIGSYAFGSDATMDESTQTPTYTGLERVYFSGTSQLRFIQQNAFYNCYNLESFVIPASVISLASKSFGNCFSFDTLAFEEGTAITEIADSAFEIEWQKGFAEPKGWDAYTHWTTATSIFSKFDYEADFAEYDFATAAKESKHYGGLVHATIPASVMFIGNRSFANQRELVDLEFESDFMSRIDSYAFTFCSSLKEVEIPGTGFVRSAEEGWLYGYNSLIFACCSNLETAIFKGEVKEPDDEDIAYRMFDGCVNLKNVGFLYNAFTPGAVEVGIRGTHTAYTTPGYNSSNPSLYYRVGFCADAQEAAEGGSSLGWVVLREGTIASSVSARMSTTDTSGAVVLQGSVPDLPEGFDGWALVTRGAARAIAPTKGIDDVAFAYPVKSSDLSNGEAVLSSESFWYDCQTHRPAVSVFDATGKAVDTSNYQVFWERLDTDGNWSETTDFSSAGTMRARVQGLGSYTSQTSTEFVIAYLEAGATIVSDGVTYVVSTAKPDGTGAELQVGDGTSLCVDIDKEGAVVIPSSVQLEGSTLAVPITSVAAGAFGSDEADEACGGITAVELPEGIASIGDKAFENMVSLENMTIPATVQSIGSNAFAYCSSMSSLTFSGKTCSRIGTSAFAYCSRLRSVELPATEKFLGLVFQSCVMLSSVTFTGKVVGSKLNQFGGCDRIASVAYEGGYWSYSWPQSTKIYTMEGSGVTKAKYNVAASGSSLQVEYAQCLSAKAKATVPGAVTLDGISSKVTGIAASAFAKTKVTNVVIKSASLTKASVKGCLKGSKAKTLKVPTSKKAAYMKFFTKANCGASVTVK